MKFKSFLFSLSLLAFAATQAQAQVDVTLNPVGLLFGDLSVGADFVISESFSVEAAIGVGGGKYESGDASFKWNNIPITGVAKYYFSPKHGADNFYADAFVRFIGRSYNAESGSDYADASWTRLGFGVGLGYKAVSAKGIVFDIGFGVGRAIVDNLNYEDNGGEQFNIDWPDIMFQGKLGIGYRFGGK